MKKIYILLTLCCVLIACKKNDVDFSFSPDVPRTGQSVSFSNLSSSGEDWEWQFGDGSTSTLKNPSHIYRNPGTYLVILQVDKKKSLTTSREITVYDSIPTFTCEDSVFYIYQDYTFVTNLYNPYNYKVEYLWYEPIDSTVYHEPYFTIIDNANTNSSVQLYFTKALKETPIRLNLHLIVNGDTTLIEKSFLVNDQPTNSVLLRTDETDYRQRIFGKRAEKPRQDASATELLDAEQDTVQIYNGYAFYLSDMRAVFPELAGFHIANRKFYYRVTDGGLWVANIDGSYPVQIDSCTCTAMTLDTYDNRIYWANENGVWYMPFIGSDNNKFVTTPTLLNTFNHVIKLAADGELK